MKVGYTITWENQSFTTANGDYDFCEITPADEGPLEVVGYDITVFETGDAQEEFLRCQWLSDNTTTGNGTSTTPRPVDSQVVHAVPPTCETVASTPASAGTSIAIHSFGLPARGGTNGPIWYPDGFGIRINQADTMLCLRLLAAGADDVVSSGTIWFAVGG